MILAFYQLNTFCNIFAMRFYTMFMCCFLIAGWLGKNVVNRAKLPNRMLFKSRLIEGKCPNREKLPNRMLSKCTLVGGKCPNRKKLPNRMLSNSRLVGGKCPNREKIPNRMLSNSRLIGGKCPNCTCQQILDTKYKKIVSYIVRLYTPYATLDIAPRNSGQIIPTV